MFLDPLKGSDIYIYISVDAHETESEPNFLFF
jgi:hypothetical protein